jgi:lycopene cyclase domain-containing protein
MEFLYFAYLLLVFAGTGAIQFVTKTFLPARAAIVSIFFSGIFFILWDVLATLHGNWAFGWVHTLEMALGNQPVEEILFFICIPFFGLTLWEFFGNDKAQPPTRRKR